MDFGGRDGSIKNSVRRNWHIRPKINRRTEKFQRYDWLENGANLQIGHFDWLPVKKSLDFPRFFHLINAIDKGV